MFSTLILHSFNLGAVHKPFHGRENVTGLFYMEISQCTYVSISTYTSYFCFVVCIIANICVCVYVFLCAFQAVKNVLRREKKQRGGGS